MLVHYDYAMFGLIFGFVITLIGYGTRNWNLGNLALIVTVASIFYLALGLL